MHTELTSCKNGLRLAQTILLALNSSYAEHSPIAPIDRGVLNSTTWGRSPEEIRELILWNNFKIKTLRLFKPKRFSVGPAGIEPATKEL